MFCYQLCCRDRCMTGVNQRNAVVCAQTCTSVSPRATAPQTNQAKLKKSELPKWACYLIVSTLLRYLIFSILLLVPCTDMLSYIFHFGQISYLHKSDLTLYGTIRKTKKETNRQRMVFCKETLLQIITHVIITYCTHVYTK